MIPKKFELCRGGELIVLGTDKFKTETLTVTLTLPRRQRSARLASLLFAVLKKGCRAYPSVVALNSHLDDLYDSNIATMYSTTGQMASVGFAIECLDRECVPGREDVLGGTVKTLEDMLFDPLLDENGLFSVKTLESEQEQVGWR